MRGERGLWQQCGHRLPPGELLLLQQEGRGVGWGGEEDHRLARFLPMSNFRSGDAQLVYEIPGSGPDVVLLHPFPLHHQFWDGVLDQLATRYRVFLPDLRAHGDSEAGDGPVTMQKLSDDLDRLCREFDVTRAIFVDVSIGGYAMFEFWRRHRERVRAL